MEFAGIFWRFDLLLNSRITKVFEMSLFRKIFGDHSEKWTKDHLFFVEKINELEPEVEKLSAEELKNKTGEFKALLSESSSLEDILPEAFAAAREAAKRTLGQRHYDVQLLGGIALHQGKIAEMQTGEGKTLTATLAVYLNALTGKGVHVITVNDYLARRDTVWMGQIYNALGLSVACIAHDAGYMYDPQYTAEIQNANLKIQNDNEELKNKAKELDKERDQFGAFKVVHEFLRPISRREAYGADITYGTNNEFGFDYLRDNLVYSEKQMVQRKHNYAIIDEVDSILIDEARTPLIISQPDQESPRLYQEFNRLTPLLKENIDYNIDEKKRAVTLTEEGIEHVEKLSGLKLYEEGSLRELHHLEESLKAHILFRRDKNYVVKNGEVIIVDEFTGRLMPGRRYSGGLHQALEAKEGLVPKAESRTLATITFQNYFRMYEKLAGMTGTAITSAEEFDKVYKLDVIAIPTNKTCVRLDKPDKIFRTEKGKWQAVVREIKERHAKGQPILVGTVSIEKNEHLSTLLRVAGVPHEILNAKNHEREGAIIAQAGRFGAVTVATNMAGRGVDIILGGNPPDTAQAERVKESSGLMVIGTERHEARRIDNQLRGRSGRQGDPGETQFFVSLEDDLLRIFAPDAIKKLLEKMGLAEDEAIENKLISGSVESAQEKVEGFNFDVRKNLLEFDDVLNKQRGAVYRKRNDILKLPAPDIFHEVSEIISLFLERFFGAARASEKIDFEELRENLKAFFPHMEPQLTREKIDELDSRGGIHAIQQWIQESVGEALKTMLLPEEFENTRLLLLQVIDHLWVDHLEAMEHLRDTVSLRAYGQRDPLIEYRSEGHHLYQNFWVNFENLIGQNILKIMHFAKQGKNIQSAATKPVIKNPVSNTGEFSAKVGRNDPCPCGSGKKYKKCHGS